MTSHEPRQDALDLVIDRFATAPVDNPDGDPGITLNITVDDEIPHQSNINTWGGFDTIKGMWFGTAAERAAANADVILTARQLAYRYALYAHTRDSGGSSGRAKGGGNFLVTLGASNWGADPATGHNVGSLMEQAGTFMHELGHTLSLGHGGVDGTNYKPNYLSVMNYWFQASWIPNPSASMNARLDYSGQGLADLDETDLDETEGIGLASVEDANDFTAWTDAAMISRGSQASIALDWDWSNTGTGTDTTLPDIDINQDRVCVSPGNDNVLDSAPANDDIVVGSQIQDGPDRICDSPTANDDVQGSTAQGRTLGDSQPELAGFDDWEFLNTTPKALSFRDSPGFAEGGEPFEDEQPELTDEEALRIAAFWQSVFEEKYTYSVKFVCVPEVGLEGHAVSPGRYRTVINVHNPHSSEVSFKTKAVIARPENEKRGEITELVETRLQDDEAMSINCKTIAERFSEDATIGDGFVVIKSNQLLDVVAVYTSRDSIEVEYVQPFTPPEEEGEEEKDEENGRDDDDKDDDGDKPRRKRADLVPQEVESAEIPRVNINGPFCAFKAGTDNGILVVKVANIGPGKASSSTTRVIFYDEPYRRRRSSFVVATVDVNTPEVDANSALLLEVPVPDSWPVGQNDPLRIIVDSEDDVDNELKENNNEADGRCFLPG